MRVLTPTSTPHRYRLDPGAGSGGTTQSLWWGALFTIWLAGFPVCFVIFGGRRGFGVAASALALVMVTGFVVGAVSAAGDWVRRHFTRRGHEVV